jgi:hypothetical protein
VTDLGQQMAALDGQRSDLERLQHDKKVAQDAFFQAAKRMSEARAHDQMMEAVRPNLEVVQAPRVPYEETPTRLIVAVMGVVRPGWRRWPCCMISACISPARKPRNASASSISDGSRSWRYSCCPA